MDELDEFDCYNQDNPVCPHCGNVFQLSYSDRALEVSYEDGGSTDWKCDCCGKDFVSITTTQYVYSTAVDADHASDEMWGPRDLELEHATARD